MTPCQDIQSRMDDWLDDLLAPNERDQIEAHLTTCRECREFFDAHRVLAADLLALSQAADRIVAAPRGPEQTAVRWLRGWRAAAAVLLAVGTLIAAMQFARSSRSPQLVEHISEGPGAVIEVAEIEPPVAIPESRPVIDVGANRMPVRMETQNPRIHLVWIYDRPSAPTDPAEAESNDDNNPGATFMNEQSLEENLSR
mgnify:CR=1 FL=1